MEANLPARLGSLPAVPMLLVVVSLVALFYLEAVRILNGEAFQPQGLMIRAGFCAAVLAGGMLAKMERLETGRLRLTWGTAGLAFVGLAGVISAVWLGAALGAFTALAASYAWLLAADQALIQGLTWPRRGLVHLLAAGTAGAGAAAAGQITTRFSEEEFYVTLQAAILSLLWLLLCLGYNAANPAGSRAVLRRGDRSIQPIHLIAALAILGGIGFFLTLYNYQNSFFPQHGPSYPGISSETPFICGTTSPDESSYQAGEIYRRLLERVQANPAKQAPEYGLLALGWNQPEQAEEFRLSLLEEATAGRFTQPANSIKYGQYEASMRVYFYSKMRASFPDLFSEAENKQIEDWFAAVNRRALTVEWVDWMYALAFRFRPSGPYENQESGAGLLALLEWQGLGDPDLSGSNRDYLAAASRGLEVRFRNSDDAIIYQPEWINNAYFQALYHGVVDENNLARAFDWLLLQAPPGGQSLRYNHIGYVHFAIPAYLGYHLTGDKALLWLAGRSLDYLESTNTYLAAKPGMEMAPDNISGVSPLTGSCLLYGDTGTPTRPGPLNPDKIVFRDGWSDSSNYLLLNLRFTGWHRYKATNTIITAFQSEPLLEEQYQGRTLAWLPEGRSLFRDKRIPRENLNGLAVERGGLSAVLNHLTSTGGPWAQDPPYFTSVERFETGPGLDISVTLLEGWHGWDHKREVYFYHQGPIIIFDQASGPPRKQAAVTWHTPGGSPQTGDQRLTLGEDTAEMVLLPVVPGEIRKTPVGDGLEVQFLPPQNGKLALATVLLSGDWVGAEVGFIDKEGAPYLEVRLQEQIIQLPMDGRDG